MTDSGRKDNKTFHKKHIPTNTQTKGQGKKVKKYTSQKPASAPPNSTLFTTADKLKKPASAPPNSTLFKNNKLKNSTLCQGKLQTPTNTESQILHMLSVEFLTVKQIARKRKVKIRMIQRHIQNLKEKGLLNPAYQKTTGAGTNSTHFIPTQPLKKPASAPQNSTLLNQRKPKNRQGTGVHPEKANQQAHPQTVRNVSRFFPGCQKDTKPIRLHGQQFVLEIIEAQDSYKDKIGVETYIKGNFVKCNRHTIEVYANQEFRGANAQDAYAAALPYWHQFFVSLENEFNVALVKERAQNIKQVKAHYADVNNELATIADNEAHKVHIRGKDGKTWLLIDFSKGHPELETVHPQESKQDMQQVIEPVYNDYRDNKGVPMPSESWRLQAKSEEHINKLTNMVYEMSAAVAVIAKSMTHTPPAPSPATTPPTPDSESKRNYEPTVGYA